MATLVAASGGQWITTTGSVATTYPTGVALGDRVFLWFSSIATFTTPAGWTQIRSVTNATIARTTVLAWFDYDGSTAAPSIAITGKGAWSMIAFRKGTAGNVWTIRAQTDATETASGTTITPPAASGALSGDTSVLFTAGREVANAATAVTTTPPTNWTEPTNGDQSTASGTTAALRQVFSSVSYRLALTAGTSTPGAVTFSLSSAASATQVILGEDAPVLAETLVDDFNTQDGSKWTADTGVTVSGGAVSIALSTAYPKYATIGSYSLAGSSVMVAPRTLPTPSSDFSQEMYLDVWDSRSSSLIGIAWIYSSGIPRLYCREQVNFVNNDTQVNYDVTAMAYWRIRGDTSGNVYWETSPDAVTWTVQRTKVTTVNLWAVLIELKAGYWGTVGTPGTAAFESINVVGSASWTVTVDDPAGLVDTQGQAVGRQIDDAAGLAGSQALSLGRQADDAAGLVGSQALAAGQTVNDLAGSTDVPAITVNRAVSDSTAATDTAVLARAGTVNDSMGVVDGVPITVGRRVDETAGLVDSQGTTPKVSTLVDAFSTQDTAKWSGWGTNVVIDAGRLRIDTTTAYSNLVSVNSYDLRDSALSVEIVQLPARGNGTTSAYLTAGDAAGNRVDIVWGNGALHPQYTVGGVTDDVSVTYNPNLHKIWRIREASGTLYWEASPNGSTWVNLRASVATPAALGAVSVVLQSGYYGTETAPGSAIFDNVNATYSDPARGALTFYVDPAGSDSNDGLTSGTPWATLAKVVNTPLHAGDQVLFARGGTWTGNLPLLGAGVSGNPITVSAYGTGAAPIISGGGSSGVAGTTRPCEVYGSFFVLDGIEFRGSIDIDVYLLGPDCTVQNCTIRWGIYGIEQDAPGPRAKILNNTVVDVNVGVIGPGTDDDGGGMSILLGGDAAEVAYNTISGAVFTSPDYGIDGAGVEIYGATNAVIHNNRISDCAGGIEMGHSATNNCTIHHNIITAGAGLGGGIAVHGGLYSVGVPDPYGPVLGTKIYHNTLVLTSGSGDGVWVGMEGEVDLRNNIVVVAGSVHSVTIENSTRTVTEGNNVLWGGTVNIQGSSSPNASSTVANPLLVSSTDLRLQPGSPAVNRGADLGYTTDYAGNPRVSGAAPDSGAFEGVVYAYTVGDTAGLTGGQALAVAAAVTDAAGPLDVWALSVGRAATDSTGTADTVALAAGQTVNDPAGLADGQAVTVARAVTDGAGGTDVTALTAGNALTDPAGSSDSTTVTAAWVRAASDDTGLTDAATAAKSGSAALTLDDPAGLMDAAATTGQWLRQADDPAGLVDAAAAAIGVVLSDTAGAADTQALTAARAATDLIGAGDSTAAAVASQVNDMAGSADTAAATVGRQADDPAGLLDAAALTGQWVRAVTDDTGLTDTAAAAKSGSQTYTITDPAGVTDALNAAGTWLRQADDPAGPTDSTTPTVDHRVDDTSAVTDTIARLMLVNWPISDLVGLTDAAAQASTTLRSVTDGAGLTDDELVFFLADVIPVRVTNSSAAVTATRSSTAVLVPVYSSDDDVL